MKTENVKWLRGMGNASYIIGIAFLIASLVASVLPPQSVKAGRELNHDDCPIDVCPNIEGTQDAIPEGMQLIDGKCVPPPPDACPNIEGFQGAIPDGMQLDNKGNCELIPPPPEKKVTICHIAGRADAPANYVILELPLSSLNGHFDENGTPKAGHEQDFFINTPTDEARCAPPPPPPTDVCPNIDGLQESLPDGLQLDQNGNCVPIPPPPPDVCPNIDGVQESPPPGMQLIDGMCVTPPTDVCPNIDDIQETIPDGMQLDKDGNCVQIPPSCEWDPALLAENEACKPKASFGSCYNPIKGLFELKVVNKGVVGYYIGYDVYNESGIYNLGYFNAGESKSFDVPLLNGNNDTLRKFASLTGEEPWTTAGGTHVLDPSTEDVCEYDPARVEVSCNPYVEQKLTWIVHNDNNYPVDYFWTWSISSEPGGMGNIAALSTGSFTTEYKPATMQIRLGSLQFYIEPEDCNIPPKEKTPTKPPKITPTVKVKTVAPPVVTPQILIPVTGVSLDSNGSQQMTLFKLGLAFLGLGLVMNGFSRTRKDWDI